MGNDELPEGVTLERVFLVEARYTADAAEKRPAVRVEHLARAAELKRNGTFVEVGAYSDGLTSSVILVRADDEASALAVARKDVYVAAGVWGKITARPFGRVRLDEEPIVSD